MKKNHFLLFKKLKNTPSAQLMPQCVRLQEGHAGVGQVHHPAEPGEAQAGEEGGRGRDREAEAGRQGRGAQRQAGQARQQSVGEGSFPRRGMRVPKLGNPFPPARADQKVMYKVYKVTLSKCYRNRSDSVHSELLLASQCMRLNNGSAFMAIIQAILIAPRGAAKTAELIYHSARFC